MLNLTQMDLIFCVAGGVFIGGALLELVFGTIAMFVAEVDDE